MLPRLSIALTALVLLTLLEAHRILLASVILDAAAGLAQPIRPLAAFLPLLLLALPACPLPLERNRRLTVALAAVVAGIARLAAASPQVFAAGLAAALTLAAAATYLGAGVGLLARRTVASGVALAICLDQLVRWAVDPAAQAYRPLRLMVPTTLALLILALALAAFRTGSPTATGPERRAGGLRLRGALALGALLFLESSILAAPAVAASRGGLDRELIAPALALIAAGAAVWLLAGGAPAHFYRPRVVAMGALAGAAAVLVGPLRGPVAGALLMGGNLAALLMLGRALAPASGRRGVWTAVGALAVLAVFDGALALASAAQWDAPVIVPWVNAVAAISLTGALLLIPRPPPAPPLLSRALARSASVFALLAGLALAMAAGRAGPTPPPRPAASPAIAAADAGAAQRVVNSEGGRSRAGSEVQPGR